MLGLPAPPAAVRVPLLLVIALVLVRAFARVTYAQLGLRRWGAWTAAEKWYFVEVVLIANAVFVALYPSRVHAPAWMALAFAWGIYQELVYRGLLQAELVRRFGAVAGVVAANLAFTFGPLHFYHWHDASPGPMFAAIFAIGLFFGLVFRRSGNLWMVGAFHGIGNAWILAPGAS
jgi:membrane protease YdiL (CAAX protease family)